MRSSHIRILLVVLLLLSNLGILLLDSQGPLHRWVASHPDGFLGISGSRTILLGVFLWNLLLLGAMLCIDLSSRRGEREQRTLERKHNRLELLVGDTRPETEVLETLSEISVRFLERMHLRPLLMRISEAARRTLKADVCALELFSDTEDPIPPFVDGTDQITFGAEVYRRVREQGSSILINNIRHHRQYVELTEQQLLGMIVAPFELHNKVIGMIGVFSREEGNFTSRELRLLHIFARHAALLIETTRLMEAVRRLSLRTHHEDVLDLAHLRERLTLERELADYEMGVAQKIQSDLLPRKLPEIPNARLEAMSRPAKEVGGDFFDVLDLGDGRWGLVIGDVSGKGVPAALVTVMSQTVLHMLAATEPSPSCVLGRLNEMLVKETPPGMFLSIFYGIYDCKSRTLRYANGGFERPVWFVHQQGESHEVASEGVALGAMENIAPFLNDTEIQFHSGDLFLLYTDGVIEAKDRQDRMFGIDRLREEVRELAQRQETGGVPALVRRIDEFSAGTDQHDDITLLSLAISRDD